MRRFLSPLLSLFTVVGGHFINRRLDLGLLYFVLLLILSMMTALIVPILWLFGDSPVVTSEAINLEFALSLAAVAVVFILSSVIVSYRMAGKTLERQPIGKLGVIAGLLAILLSIPTAFWVGTLNMKYLRMAGVDVIDLAGERGRAEEYEGSAQIDYFHEVVRYGGKWLPRDLMKSMPKGNAFVSGRIQYQDSPVVGATVNMVFDDKYQSGAITTDEKGVFSLQVPEGEWRLNRIEIEGWPNRPTGESFTVLGGPNSALSESMYRDGPDFKSEGLKIQATKSREVLSGLELRINSNVKIEWPESAKQAADVDQDKIIWGEMAGASRYQVQLHHITKDGKSTIYSPAAWINTDGTDVPLNAFQTVSDDSIAENVYSVEVFAFDESGKLVAGSDNIFGGLSLVLKGIRVVDVNKHMAIEGLSDLSRKEQRQEVEKVYRDEKRLKAARTLVEDGMPEAANKLVQRVESPGLEVKKQTVEGLILAEQGRCEEAREKLDAANKKRGSECYPDLFTERCAND